MDALARIPLLHRLPEAERTSIAAAGHERRLARGELLFSEGDRAEAFFALLDGQIKLVRFSPRGKEMLLHLVNPGQSFAEAALFADGTYPATAMAVEATRLWVWPRARFEALVRGSPALGLAMLASVSVWTRRLANTLEMLTQRRVEERFAIYLLSRVGGREPGPGESVPLPEARHLIAAQCGTAPEVLSRTVRRLEDEGVLESHPDRVVVRDPERLRALAEWIAE